MNKKGFTLIEVLAVVVIIAILGAVGIISYQSFFGTAEEKYYVALEDDVLLAAHDYFADHRDYLPTGNNVSWIAVSDLVQSKYIEPLKDSKGNNCGTGKVYAYRENNKYFYEVCMECGDFKSDGKYCNEIIDRHIYISAKTKSGKAYNVNASYNLASYTNNENVVVTFRMENDVAKKYQVVNTKTDYTKSCDGKTCSIEVDKSGTYKVMAFNASNEIIATDQYINVKIARNGPKFTISGVDKALLSKTESACKSGGVSPKKRVSFTINKDNVNEEYKSIKYRINRKDDGVDVVYGNYKEITDLVISEELESGKYELEVVISNFADSKNGVETDDTIRVTAKTKEFYISYLIDLEYEVEDGNPHPVATHEVVKGQKYDFVSELPKRRTAYGQSLEVRWHPQGTEYTEDIRVYGTTIVTANCTHRLMGLISIPVDVPSDWTTYCANVTYNGTTQTITKSPPTNVVFKNNTGIDAVEYTITAHIDSPLYIWKGDWTFADKTFKCSIAQKSVSVNWSNLEFTYNGSEQGPTATAQGVTGETINLVQTTKVNAGTYTATTSCSSVTGGRAKCSNYSLTNTSKDFVIKKAPNPITLVCASLTYNGSNQNLISNKSATAGDIYISKSSLTQSNYSTAGGTALSSAQGNGAGDYTVYAYTPGNSNYESSSTSKTCSIAKATNSITLNCASLTYNGSDQNLISSKSATAGDVYISKTSLSQSNYSTAGGTALTSAQGKGGGNYTVYAYTPGNSNYAQLSSSTTCSIGKATNPITASNLSWSVATSSSSQSTPITGVSNAQGTVSYSKISGNGNFSISGSSLVMAANTGKGVYAIGIRVSAAGNGNYQSGYVDITMTVTVYTSTSSAFSAGSSSYTHSFTVSGLTSVIGSSSNNGTSSCSNSGTTVSCTVSNMGGSSVTSRNDCISIYGSDTYYYGNGCYTYLGLGYGYNPTTQQWWCWDDRYGWSNTGGKPPGPNDHCNNKFTQQCPTKSDCISVGSKVNPENSKQNVCICYVKRTGTKYTATVTIYYY